jgi:DNA-binding CsgD family transcriptional regulator
MNLIYYAAASFLIFTAPRSRSVIHDYDKKSLGTILISMAVLFCIPLIFYSKSDYAGLVFILLFFAGNAFIPFYLNYFTFATSSAGTPEAIVSMEDFCRKYDISPRETDIVREICNGLSNKEISDKLFISLQTVKDHTHRIYIKANVRSRVQLITLVKEELLKT